MFELLFRHADRFKMKRLLQPSSLSEKEISRLSDLGRAICKEYAHAISPICEKLLPLNLIAIFMIS